MSGGPPFLVFASYSWDSLRSLWTRSLYLRYFLVALLRATLGLVSQLFRERRSVSSLGASSSLVTLSSLTLDAFVSDRTVYSGRAIVSRRNLRLDSRLP